MIRCEGISCIYISSYIGLDVLGSVCGITICNVKDGVVKVHDILDIATPAIVDFVTEKSTLKIVRVDNPQQIKLNNKNMDNNDCSWIEMKVESSHI